LPAAPRFASAEQCPCFQLDVRERSSPSGVRGPVLGTSLLPLYRTGYIDKCIAKRSKGGTTSRSI
jgi:hypothetical protein